MNTPILTPVGPAAALRRGIIEVLPLAASIAAYGLLWGVLAGQKGLSLIEVMAMSSLVFAGASQFVVLDLWRPDDLPVVAIILSTFVVNLRMLLMAATLKPLMVGVPKPLAYAAVFLVTDESWGLTMGAQNGGRRVRLAYLVGAGLTCWSFWQVATVTGRLLGALIDDPARYGLDFVFTATFLALLFGMWKGKADFVPWLTGAGVAIVVARLVPGNFYILAGGIVGSLAGAAADLWRQKRRGTA